MGTQRGAMEITNQTQLATQPQPQQPLQHQTAATLASVKRTINWATLQTLRTVASSGTAKLWWRPTTRALAPTSLTSTSRLATSTFSSIAARGSFVTTAIRTVRPRTVVAKSINALLQKMGSSVR